MTAVLLIATAWASLALAAALALSKAIGLADRRTPKP